MKAQTAQTAQTAQPKQAEHDAEFPHALLHAPVEQRCTYFRDWLVMHPKLAEAKEALVHAIRFPAGQSLIQVFGCAGVGKTTLRFAVEKWLLEDAEARARMADDPGYIPLISIVTPPPDQGPFGWRDIYMQGLLALGEPAMLINRKRHTQLQFLAAEKVAAAPVTPRKELRLALASGLYYRHVDVMFFDEAQHFQMVSMAQRLQNQMDNLKWLAEVSDTQVVLVGTYDLLNLTDLSGQLARRSVSVHFGRYHADKREEFRQFAGVVLAFQRHLPLPHEPDLVSLSDYLYERSLGCVGLLKDWLTRALSEALMHGESTLTQSRLEACVDLHKLVAVAKEAAAGEQRMQSDDALQAELKALLKMASRATSANASGKGHKPAAGTGRRRAVRDAVGVGATGSTT